MSSILADVRWFALRNIIVGGLLILLTLVVGGVLLWVRRRFHPASRRPDGSDAGSFSLEQLGEMRRAGTISDQEFRRLRRLALGLDVRPARSDNSASSAPPGTVDEKEGARSETDGPCTQGDEPPKE